MAQDLSLPSSTIRLGDRLASSNAFKMLFRDGMALVEETAAYLDGEGRAEARRLPRLAALAYASESMRLTTRLMQVASWLLLQRAINEGEMSEADASADKRRTRVDWQAAPPAPAEHGALPATLAALIASSLRLQERLVRLDRMMSRPEAVSFAPQLPPLEGLMTSLRTAFTPEPRGG